MSIDDSGFPTYSGPPEMQMQEAERRRLIYGAIPTKELKRREPRAFEPKLSLLFLQLIQAQRIADFYMNAEQSVKPNDCEFEKNIRYSFLAHERAVEIVKRKLLKEMKYLGFDKIDDEMMRLAQHTYDNMPNDLGLYLFDNSPVLRTLIGD